MNTIFDAIRSEEFTKVRQLLEDSIDLLNIRDQRGSTPLLLASYLGLDKITSLILNYKPDVNCKDHSGNTALMGVAFKGYSKIAQLLIDAGADVNIENTNKSTALLYAK